MTWEPKNLSADQYAQPSEPPRLCGIVYGGKRHVISGPPEAAKSLTALIVSLEAIRAGMPVAIVDFESGPSETRRLLEDLGATPEEIAAVYYVEPDGPPDQADIDSIVNTYRCELVTIDAAAGAFDVSDLDDNSRGDVERFARAWVRPLWLAGVATLVVDHVVKNVESRGRFTIGSERKTGGADVHLGLHAIKQLHRGSGGLIAITTHKDRPAHLARPRAAELELHSDPDTHRITWQFNPADDTTQPTGFRPTALMERVSRYLEEQPEPVLATRIYEDVKGKRTYLSRSLSFLVAEGHITEVSGNRRSRLIRSVKPFRESVPNGSHSFPSSEEPPFPSFPPSKGGNDRRNGHGDPDNIFSEVIR